MKSVELSAIAHHFGEMLKILNTLQWNPSIMDTIGNQNFVCYREVSPPQLRGFRYISGVVCTIGLLSTTWLHFQSFPFLYAGREG